MRFNYEIINCQKPNNTMNIKRTYKVIRCIFKNKTDEASKYYQQAWDLAKQVNPLKANDSTSQRDKERLILDALGGILAEYGWFYYIKRNFGDIVNFTEFKSSIGQIDLLLNNGKTLEVRSSFPRNGIKFAICNAKYNFKNICKYDNLYKPNEMDKDFFACVLFETTKNQMVKADEIIFYLIGGSTRKMMLDNTISYTDNLTAEDDLIQQKTNYKVIRLYNALDIEGFEKYMTEELGYPKILNDQTF
ncbi:hypothetical protein C3H71_08575 [Campylobacter jejuni]|uniref:hypothetical protein n=2 Tax=Campylobacteraceae TaxID=72294 RepID=UPI00073A6689|nr:hypothetical protein [Campylobacter jejuni]ALV00814.1 hypothetical protein ATE51_06022 [Campylobacter coli]EDO7410315.1 hypothetical protein [Campylobacter jejuni]MEA8973917.1 hypothetical protein [Campylobacter jejuni]RTH54663.1 hypothetical protein C3I54_08670 [Campylobacter jejuni]RTI92334.1 hypothetical protein C3I02_08275 [Campylobacter jejuni]